MQNALRSFGLILRRVPFTLVFLLVQIGANWAAGTLDGTLPRQALMDWGVSGEAFERGDLLTLLTSIFLSHSVPMFVHQLLLVAIGIGLFEYWFGTLRAFLTFFIIDIAATAGVVALIAGPLSSVSIFADAHPLLDYDVGMSAGGFALIGALAASLRGRWFWLVLMMAGLAVKVWADFDPIADTVHPLTFLVGFILSIVWRPQRLPKSGTPTAHATGDTATSI